MVRRFGEREAGHGDARDVISSLDRGVALRAGGDRALAALGAEGLLELRLAVRGGCDCVPIEAHLHHVIALENLRRRPRRVVVECIEHHLWPDLLVRESILPDTGPDGRGDLGTPLGGWTRYPRLFLPVVMPKAGERAAALALHQAENEHQGRARAADVAARLSMRRRWPHMKARARPSSMTERRNG